MSEPNSKRLSESRQAAEKYERSRTELDAATQEQKRVAKARRDAYRPDETDYLDAMNIPRSEETTTPDVKKHLRERQESRQAADEADRAAQEKVNELWRRHKDIEREYLRATVQPRVESSKLRHEEYKLRATLSSASIVGIAATSGLLLPSDRYYIWVLVLSFLALFASVVLNLGAMRDISNYVEGTLITGEEVQGVGIVLWLTHNALTVGLVFFTIFITLNLFS